MDCGSEYDAGLSDLGASLITDINNGGSFSLLKMPQIEAAAANGGTIRVLSGREYNYDGNRIGVIPHDGEGCQFLYGTRVMSSLFSTGVGDFLELQPENIDGTLYWRALNPQGAWRDDW